METGAGPPGRPDPYDVETGTLYWATAIPFPPLRRERRGSNLYTNCVLALDVKTGKLRWHYQFTPHDLTIGMLRNR